MKIVVLAAGRGQRFQDAGFTIAKPLISYGSKTLIEHAVLQTGHVPDSILVVGTVDVCTFLNSRFTGLRVIPVAVTQRGPAMSALLAGGFIEPSEEVFFVDCDVVFADNILSTFILQQACFSSSKDDAAVLTTNIIGDISSYCSVQTLLASVTDVAEKLPGVGGRIITGCYYFKEWESFRAAVMLLSNSKAGEIYMSDVLKLFLHDAKVVTYTDIPADAWVSVGTPKELEEANADK